MNQRTLRIPSALKHTDAEQTDAALQGKAQEHVERHPALGFLADVLKALHASPRPLRNATAFFSAFPPQEVMEALGQRPDLRALAARAITGGAMALLRRLPAAALAAQVDLLAADDLPESERGVRVEADRALSVQEIYLKYLDPVDIATYLPAPTIWRYEAQDGWWKTEPTEATRALMAAELKSIRRYVILTDSEFIDLLGDETLERHLSLTARTGLRKAARRAAAEGRPFTDTDLFSSVGAQRDLVDEIVQNTPFSHLREVVEQAIAILGLHQAEASGQVDKVAATATTSSGAIPVPVGVARSGPKLVRARPNVATPGVGKAAPQLGERRPGTGIKPLPPGSTTNPLPAGDVDAPPQPDDEFAFVEEASGRV
jgi:hypothetical protein